jgi:RNA recognition motif-containing protein
MNTKVYVDNLSTATTETDLIELFAPYGNVVNANIAMDRADHKLRGFGFVTMVTPEGARAAMRALNGKVIGTRALIASEAWPNEEHNASREERRLSAAAEVRPSDPDNRLV